MPNQPVIRVVFVGSLMPDGVRKGLIPRKDEIIKFQFSNIIREKILEKYNISRIFCASDVFIDLESSLLEQNIIVEPRLKNRNYGILAGRNLKNLSAEEQE